MTTPSFHGFLVLDKPGGPTSREAVNQAQHWFPRGTRIGHTGTLDPLATGVLVLAVGAGTRLTEYIQDMDKVYQTGIELGARSDTDDADGTIAPVPLAVPPDRSTLEAALQGFLGDIEQVPPAFSAAKVTGRRAYDLARRGREVVLSPRRVRVYGIDLRTYDYPGLELEVRCGKGTYIRSLARDLGQRLGCGGYISRLRRTRVGPFRVEDGLGWDAERDMAQVRLLPLEAAVSDLPRVELERSWMEPFRQGRTVPLPAVGGEMPRRGPMAVFAAGTNQFLGIGTVEDEARQLRPRKIIPPFGQGA